LKKLLLILTLSAELFSQNILRTDESGRQYWYQKINGDAPKQIKVAFISDMHSALDKWPNIVTFLKEFNKRPRPDNESWVIYGGDYIIGDGNFDLRDKGEVNYKFISEANNLVVAAIGNHDLDQNIIDPSDVIKKYNIPLISSNVKDLNTGIQAYPAYLIREYDDKSFLFLSFVDDGPNNNNEFSQKMFIEKPDYIYNNFVYEVCSKNKIDEIIMVNHLGYQDIKNLCLSTSSVNLIFNGHKHTPRIEAYLNANGQTTNVIYGGVRNNNIQKIDLIYEQHKERYVYDKSSYKNIPVKQFEKDINTSQEIKKFINETPLPNEYLYLENSVFFYKAPNKKEKFAASYSALGRTDIVNAPFPDLVNDALRWTVGANVSFFNSDGLRKSIKQKTENSYFIKGMDIYNAIPFENYICYAYMTGEQISQLTNMVIYGFPENRRGYFTGVKGKNTQDYFQAETIWDNTLNTYVNIELNKTYKVAFTDFYAEEHPRFSDFLSKNNIMHYKTNILDHLAVIEYIEYLKSADNEWIDKYQKRATHKDKEIKITPDRANKMSPIDQQQALELIQEYLGTKDNSEIKELEKKAFYKLAQNKGYLYEAELRFLFGPNGSGGYYNYIVYNLKTQDELNLLAMISFLCFHPKNMFMVLATASEPTSIFISNFINSFKNQSNIEDFNSYANKPILDKKQFPLLEPPKPFTNSLIKNTNILRTQKTRLLKIR
jgi:2',3'-cyclic-nucleotide 2'-phosphodiesterase (5'-nucleotidase family)